MRLAAAAATAVIVLVTAVPASARFFDPAVKAAEPLTEQVACRTVRERIVRPSGRVIFETRRVCSPGPAMGMGRGGCTTVRERVVRPNGAVVYKSIRRCR
ncbi:hypothetical protein [Rhodoplanes roseus]|uniref:Uncharacterized protein n=1 Tax=Rhodoplanes roseus TaxID=29409 RepID=A0A327KPJ6_9BRAD|nr:hypothetical protein [Rhodoplanes roseus]RAI40820.1 hypothetical protein CH341_23010 [Rhodoplanes roseus]